MSDLSTVLSNLSVCITKYKLNPTQAAELIRRVDSHESNPDPMMDMQLRSDDELVEQAYSDYRNHSTGYRIGEYQS